MFCEKLFPDPRRGGKKVTAAKRRRHIRRTLQKDRLTVKLCTMGDYPHADTVMAEVQGLNAHAWADHDGYIAGSSWETPRDMPGFAYAMPCNHAGLVNELRAEGYVLDLSEYSEPDFSEGSKPCGKVGNCGFCYPDEE